MDITVIQMAFRMSDSAVTDRLFLQEPLPHLTQINHDPHPSDLDSIYPLICLNVRTQMASIIASRTLVPGSLYGLHSFCNVYS